MAWGTLTNEVRSEAENATANGGSSSRFSSLQAPHSTRGLVHHATALSLTASGEGKGALMLAPSPCSDVR